MPFSRTRKNQILISIQVLFLMIQLVLVQQGVQTWAVWGTWALAISAVLGVHFILLRTGKGGRLKHAILFLLYGCMLGLTLGNLLRGRTSHWLLLLWVLIAVVGAIIHYRPHPDDPLNPA